MQISYNYISDRPCFNFVSLIDPFRNTYQSLGSSQVVFLLI